MEKIEVKYKFVLHWNAFIQEVGINWYGWFYHSATIFSITLARFFSIWSQLISIWIVIIHYNIEHVGIKLIGTTLYINLLNLPSTMVRMVFMFFELSGITITSAKCIVYLDVQNKKAARTKVQCFCCYLYIVFMLLFFLSISCSWNYSPCFSDMNITISFYQFFVCLLVRLNPNVW